VPGGPAHDYGQRYYGGHIGYRIEEIYRGNNYDSKACKIIKNVAIAHGMNRLIITCNPENFPSRKTCEKAGLKLKEIVDLSQYVEIDLVSFTGMRCPPPPPTRGIKFQDILNDDSANKRN